MGTPLSGRVAEALRRSTTIVRHGSRNRGGNGSGVVLTGDRLVTNAHVVEGARSVTVESWEGKSVTATILGIDRARDLALLAAPGLDAPAAQFGDSDRVLAGTPVLAIGNPLGFTGAVSNGVIRAHETAIASIQRWIFADVRLAPGNSGGPLADLQGQVIGINTMMTSGGLALAVPSRAVQGFVTRQRHGIVLGVTLHQVALPNGGPGMLILEIQPGGPAERASLLPGDIIVSGNGRGLHYTDDLQAAIDESQRSLLNLDFRRGGEQRLRHVVVQLTEERATTAA